MLSAFKNVVNETMKPYIRANQLPDINFENGFDDVDFELDFQSPETSMLDDIDFEPVSKHEDVRYSFEPSDVSSPYLQSTNAATEKHGLPENLLNQLINTESGFNPDALNLSGATGIAQIVPKFHPDVDATDPEASIDYAGSLLKKHYDKFGDWDSALAAYNAGPTRVSKGMDKLPEETRNYLEKINKFRVSQDSITEDIKPTSAFREPGIYQEPEPKERSLISKAWESITKSIKDEKADKVKSANAVAMAEEFGIPPSQAYDNLDALSKEVGLRGQPTFQELIEGMAVPPIVLGALMNPLATAIGVGTFMSLSEVENALISTHPDIDYEFGTGKGFQELLPEDTSQGVKDLVWTADMAWKAFAGGVAGRKITPAVHSGLQSMYTKFTKDVSAKYNLPKEVYISPNKIREFHGRGRKGVISEAESNMLKGLGLSRQQYIDALKQGIDVRIPAEKIIFAVDKPWFARIKRIVGARPYSLEFTRAQKPTVTTHMERLAPPVKSVPRPVTKPAEVAPEFSFVSKKGHKYEKIGDKWYGSKGREIVNKFVISAAEKGKVAFETIDEAVDKALRGVEEPSVVKDRLKIKQTKPITKLEPPIEISTEDSLFRQPIEDTERNLQILPKYEKIDTAEQLTTRIESEINSELNGNLDATNARQLLSQLSTQAKLWASGDEAPGGIFSDMASDELVVLSEYLGELENWASSADRLKIERTGEPTVELYSGIPVTKITKDLKKLHKAVFSKDLQKTLANIVKELGVTDVLDIFGGLGKIGGIKKYGFKGKVRTNEIEPNWGGDTIALHKKAGVDEVTIGDSRSLDIPSDSVGAIVTSPTYGNLMGLKAPSKKDSYQGSLGEKLQEANTGGMVWGPAYEKLHKEIYFEASRVVKPGGFFVLNMKDKPVSAANLKNNWIPKKGSTVEVSNQVMKATDWHVKALEDVGFKEIDRIKVDEPKGSVGTQKFGRQFSVGYEDVVVMGKPEEPSVTLGMGLPIQDLYDKLTTPKKTKTVVPNKPPDPFTGVKEEARQLVRDRTARLGLANYDTNKFINGIEQRITEKQDEVLPFVLEKTNIPDEFNRPDLQKVLAKDREKLKSVAKDIKEWFNTGWKNIKKHIPDLTVKQIEDYVTHIWDIPKHKKAEATSWFSTQNQFLDRRFIDTYAEGIKRGYKPKHLKITELIKIHDTVTNRAIENTKYIKALLKMNRDGTPLIDRTDKAPLDWIEVDYPALTRRIPLKKGEKKKRGEFVKESKVRVHPDLVRPLKVIFEERFDHPVVSAYEAINGVLKKAKLSFSLFHHGALGEVGIASGIPIKTANLYFNPVKIYKSLVRGESDVFAKEVIARDSIIHGTQYGATADIPINKIQGYLNDLARVSSDLPIANKLTSFLSDANSVWDKALWSYLHDTLKLYGYESLVGKLDPKLDAEQTRMAKEEIAQFVNDTFGGQNWENLMITPKEIQMMTWSLLSADWTVSTTRQALAVTGIGKIHEETVGLRRKTAWKFWARAGLYFGIGMNLLNAMYRKKDMGENPQYYPPSDIKEYSSLEIKVKGRDEPEVPGLSEAERYGAERLNLTMFGNTVGKTTYLFNGRYEDGTERYVRWGKQFRDFFELLTHPLKKIGGKAAPVPQLLSEIFTGHTLSGFKNDDTYKTKGLEKVKGIAKTIAKAPLPISVLRYLKEGVDFRFLDTVMQSSRGMSRYSAMEYFKKAIIESDEDTLRDTYIGAVRNNLPAYTLFVSSLSWAEAEATAALAETNRDMEDIEIKLLTADSISDKKRYSKILSRLRKEKSDRDTEFKLLKSAVSRARVYSDLEQGRVNIRLP